MIKPELPTTYNTILEQIKNRVKVARYEALIAVNRELIELYWDIGKIISIKQKTERWGKAVVEKLATDLQVEFSGVKGFSSSNLWRMRNFYNEYKKDEKLAQAVREIGWGHNITILEKVKDPSARHYYITNCRNRGWSRAALEEKIKSNEFDNILRSQTNFDLTVDNARKAQLMWEVKDEYNFSFLEIANEATEKELEDALVANIVKFLAEMGGDFSFVGRQYKITVDDKEFFIDLLFYHRRLRCLIAVELKIGEFLFEYTGKMAGYLAALDSQVKYENESPSIGIIICRTKSRTIVEYALTNIKSPIGVATFNYKELPSEIAKYLPSDQELSSRLSTS